MLTRSLSAHCLLQKRYLISLRVFRALAPHNTIGACWRATLCVAAGKSMAPLAPLPPAPILQRDIFSETLQLKALRLPKRECQKYMKLLAGCARHETGSAAGFYTSCHSRQQSFMSQFICLGTPWRRPGYDASYQMQLETIPDCCCWQRLCKRKVKCFLGLLHPHFSR